MPRRPRFATGGYVFHVLNRAVGKATIFKNEGDYQAFEQLLNDARRQTPMRLLSYCIMPNHWHLVLWPRGDDDLAEYMRWLTATHAQRWHGVHGTVGTGPLYQGRFKSFPIQEDDHFYTVCRYVERNALRANLVSRAERWRWGSLWHQVNPSGRISLDAWPVPQPADWVDIVNSVETEAELVAVRRSIRRGVPFGDTIWQRSTARSLGLESTLRPQGRPPTHG
jgi:putative transposase